MQPNFSLYYLQDEYQQNTCCSPLCKQVSQVYCLVRFFFLHIRHPLKRFISSCHTLVSNSKIVSYCSRYTTKHLTMATSFMPNSLVPQCICTSPSPLPGIFFLQIMAWLALQLGSNAWKSFPSMTTNPKVVGSSHPHIYYILSHFCSLHSSSVKLFFTLKM